MRHSIDRSPRADAALFANLSPLSLPPPPALSRPLVPTRALVVSRATTTGVAPQGEHTRLYGFMYQKWWVHLFVISSCFCFYRDFIYDRIAEPQICDEIGWRVLFRRCTRMYVCTYVRSSVRPSVRSFVRSFSIISRRFYIHYNLRGGGGVVIRRATISPHVASHEPRVMIMNFSPPADGWSICVACLFVASPGGFFIGISGRAERKENVAFVWNALSLFLINFQSGNRVQQRGCIIGDFRHRFVKFSPVSDWYQLSKSRSRLGVFRSLRKRIRRREIAESSFAAEQLCEVIQDAGESRAAPEQNSLSDLSWIWKTEPPLSRHVCHPHARARTKERQFFALETFRNAVVAWRGPGRFRIINLGDIC